MIQVWVQFSDSGVGSRFKIHVWDSFWGFRFGIQVWGSGLGSGLRSRFGIQV